MMAAQAVRPYRLKAHGRMGRVKPAFQKEFGGALNSMRFRAPKVFGKVLYTGVVNN
jgi:hypothetical protein